MTAGDKLVFGRGVRLHVTDSKSDSLLNQDTEKQPVKSSKLCSFSNGNHGSVELNEFDLNEWRA